MFGNWEMSHVEGREPVDAKTRKSPDLRKQEHSCCEKNSIMER